MRCKSIPFNNQKIINLIFFLNRTIRKLRLSKPLTSRMTEVTPDLGYNVINVIIELNDVELEGEYEAVNSKQLEMLSITHYGNLE